MAQKVGLKLADFLDWISVYRAPETYSWISKGFTKPGVRTTGLEFSCFYLLLLLGLGSRNKNLLLK